MRAAPIVALPQPPDPPPRNTRTEHHTAAHDTTTERHDQGELHTMTETDDRLAGTRARRTPKAPSRKGLKIKRVFTTAGVHPYDEVTWERRDVVMTNWRDGSINFEQRGVEFP